MKKYFLEAVIFILLILNVFVIYSYRKSTEEMDKSALLIKQLRNAIIEKEEFIENKDYIEAKEFINLDANISIDTIQIFKESIEQPLLIYRYSLSSCQSCIDSILVLIKKSSDMLKQNIRIVSDDKTVNELYVRLHYSGLNEIRYDITEKLPFPFDSEKKPYFFIIDKNKVVRFFFIPDISNKKRTLNYFNYIMKKYWS